MKRSVNFAGSRATCGRKAMEPESIIAAMRHVGMSDEEIRATLEKMQAKEHNDKGHQESANEQ